MDVTKYYILLNGLWIMRLSRSLNLKHCATLTSCASILFFDVIVTLERTLEKIMHAEVSAQSFETDEKKMPNWQKVWKSCHVYFPQILSHKNRSNSVYLWSILTISYAHSCLCFSEIYSGKEMEILCKRKNVTDL